MEKSKFACSFNDAALILAKGCALDIPPKGGGIWKPEVRGQNGCQR
jgi:hypothetical protein